MFAMNKPEVNFFNNCEQNQEIPRPVNHVGNQSPHWVGDNNPNMNGNIILNRPIPELPMHAMSRLSISNSHNESRMPNGDMHDDLFHSDSFSNFSSDSFSARHNEMDRMNDHLKRIWMNSGEYKVSPTFQEQGSSPFHLTDPGSTQGSYLSRLRGIAGPLESSDNSQAFPFSYERQEERSPTRNRETNGHMTAGPLSMSYPDIPDILSSHLLPHGKEGPSKVMQKPQRSENSTAGSFMFELSLQSNNESSLRYPQLSSEGMTYAKILRSPQQ